MAAYNGAVRRLIACACLVLSIASGARAQETRAGLIAARQAAKAAANEPAHPTKPEQVTDWIQQRVLTERPSGIFPDFDSVYGGGGFTLGAGYRKAFADRSLWMIRGLYLVQAVQADRAGRDLAACIPGSA